MALIRKARRFNHGRVTSKVEKQPISKLRLGTICQFNYGNKSVTDKKPLILFLGRDKSNKLVHGLNLNYMSEYEVNYLFGKMNASAIPGGQLVKDTLEVGGSDNKAFREIEYYRISLGDVFGRTGDSKSPTKKLYDRYLKNFVSNRDVYRTYKESLIRGNFTVMLWKFNQSTLRRLGGDKEKIAPKKTEYGTPEDANKKIQNVKSTKMDKE